MDLRLEGKVVLISGGAKGIGAAAVRAFVAEGARVLVADRDAAAGRDLARETGARFLEADLSDPQQCRRAVGTVVETFQALDVLVNNAGFNDAKDLGQAPEIFWGSVRSNLLHVYALTHYARAHLVQAKGAIVNLGSKVAMTGQGATSGYAAAKGAVLGLTREWAAALAGQEVRVNAVIPAECLTDQYRSWFDAQPDPKEAQRQTEALIPLGHRMTAPEEIADAIVFLASPRALHITGQFLLVDGGYTHLDRALGQPRATWSAG